MIKNVSQGHALLNRLEQLFAIVITAGLVVGNFLMFTPWRNGHDPRGETDPPPHFQREK